MILCRGSGSGAAAPLRGSEDLAPYVKGWVLLPSAGTLLLLLGLTVLVVATGSLAPARRAATLTGPARTALRDSCTG